MTSDQVSVDPEVIEFTEESNALDYLGRASDFIRRIESDPYAWKWVVLALHGALYGFAVCACKGTDCENVKRKGKLITLDDSLKMCQDESWMCTLHGARPLVLSSDQKKSIAMLKRSLRNHFEHYVPRAWAIELHGMPRICVDVLEVIRVLSVEIFRYQRLTSAQRGSAATLIDESITILKSSRLYVEERNAIERAKRA